MPVPHLPGVWRLLITDYQSRNYDHVASLWQHEKWLPESAVTLARAHYSAYMVKRGDGLRVISLNTNLCKSYTLNLTCPILRLTTSLSGYRYECNRLSSLLLTD